MKMKHLSKFIAFLSLILITSCSKDEKPLEQIQQANFTSLILTSSANGNILLASDVATFTVMGDDGVDYTAQSTISVNGTPISGNDYTFGEGTYNVQATYFNISSNTLNYEVISNAGRVVTVERNKSLRNQPLSFKLFDTNNTDYTSEATFYVNGNAITGNTFTSPDAGIFEVYATYDLAGNTESTSTKNFEYYIPKRKIVLEDYTGTWCGYCPRVSGSIEVVHGQTDQIAVVAIHKTGGSLPDPMDFVDLEILENEFNVSGYPAARINRTTRWLDPQNPQVVMDLIGQDSQVSMAVNSSVAGNNLSVQVKIVSENGIAAGDKLVVYLTESNIIYAQTNYYNGDSNSPFFGLGNPIPAFVHNDALRNSLSAVLGDNLPESAAFGETVKNYSLALPSNYVNDNLKVVVMVVSADNTAINGQFAKVGVNKDFE